MATELEETLDKLENINRWLGGNKVTINGLKKILENHPKEQEITTLVLIPADFASAAILNQLSIDS